MRGFFSASAASSFFVSTKQNFHNFILGDITVLTNITISIYIRQSQYLSVMPNDVLENKHGKVLSKRSSPPPAPWSRYGYQQTIGELVRSNEELMRERGS